MEKQDIIIIFHLVRQFENEGYTFTEAHKLAYNAYTAYN